MKTHRNRVGALTTTIALVLVIAAWIILAPTQFGGQTVYVIVSGNSMEPGFHRGDLVLLRPAASYAIGDIATYRHPDLGPVIHRIVAEQDGRFTLKGDNNAWLDAYHPTQTEMIGKFWVFLPSVGKIVGQLRQPWAMAAVAGLVVAATAASAVFGPAHPSAKRRRRATSSGKQTAVKQSSSAGKADLFFVLATVAVASLMLGLFAFTQPVTRTLFSEVPYTHAGQFSYSASAPPGLYNGNMVKTGEPIFRRLITRANVAFDYQLQAEQLGDLTGTARLVAVVGSSNGWRWTFELQPETSFRGAHARLDGVLDLAHIQAVLDGVEQQAGVASTQYTLALMPTIVVSGTLAGQGLQESFAPQLVFLLDQLQLQLAAGQGLTAENTDPLKPLVSKTLRYGHEAPNTIALLGLSLPVTTGRVLSVIGLALALLSMGGVALAGHLGATGGPAAQIQNRYAALLIDVRDSDWLADRRLVEVARIEDLARIAERNGRMILHEARGEEHRYFIQEEDVVYHYRLAAAQPTAAGVNEGGRDVA